MIRLSNVRLNVKRNDNEVLSKAKKILKLSDEEVKSIEISKYSIDARKKSEIKYVYSVDLEVVPKALKKCLKNKNVVEVKEYSYQINKANNTSVRPIIIGAGPAGLFCALGLCESGLKPIIIEQGKDVDSRKNDIDNLMNNGKLHINSNIQFGEGGAGTFSDGKLTTGVKDKRKAKVIKELVEAGSPKEIKYLTKPHIGTDNLVNVVKNIRHKIMDLGGEFRFESKMTNLLMENNKVIGVEIKDREKTYIENSNIIILALGHSARDSFQMLYNNNVPMTAKSFAVGVRIEHSREFINKSQYGEGYNKSLPTADYKMAVNLPSGIGVYTFCMCPGGIVVPATSEENSVVVNGMSYYNRMEENSNSGILVTVTPEMYKDVTGDSTVMAGVKFQRQLEKASFEAGGSNYNAPIMLMKDFLANKKSTTIGSVIPSYKPDVTPADFSTIFPHFIIEALQQGLKEMDKKIKGFAMDDAVLTAVESRSSSPIRIERDENGFSKIEGLVPCGEGAGYSGGITSSAIDGLRCSEAIVNKINGDLG